MNPRMNEKGYEEYYRTKYFGEYQPKIESQKPYADEVKDSRAIKIFEDLKDYISVTSKVIEIGSGEGVNLIVLKEKGFTNVTGLEISPECCDKLELFYHIRCVKKSLREFGAHFNGGGFDCVILSHTLEHFVEPKKALAII